MTDKQICDRIRGALSASMMPMEMELECNRFLDRCLNNGWIPVEERLPEAERIAWTEKHPDIALKVLAIIRGSYQAAELWYSGVFEGKPSFWGISYDGESTISYAVTHWMPLPEPPGKDVNCDE